MKARTRFSSADLKALKAEAKAAREVLSRLSDRLLEANLAHIGGHFYSADVRSVSDRLATRLNGVDELLYADSCRHARVSEEMTV